MPREPTTAWGQSTLIEKRYTASLQRLRRMILGHLASSRSPHAIRRKLQELTTSQDFIAFTQDMATNMAMQVYRQSGMQWRMQAQQASAS